MEVIGRGDGCSTCIIKYGTWGEEGRENVQYGLITVPAHINHPNWVRVRTHQGDKVGAGRGGMVVVVVVVVVVVEAAAVGSSGRGGGIGR